ncbi:putative Histidine kinase [Gammaproteobacteria bacterium]
MEDATIVISQVKLRRIEERARKLALEKSFLQLAIHMMNQLSTAPGLENTLGTVLHVVTENIGGRAATITYWIGSEIHVMDIYGTHRKIECIDDTLVLNVIAAHQPIEEEQDFRETFMTSPGFNKAWSWGYPLLVGTELIGVFKIDGLHVSARDFSTILPTFFHYAALIVKNEISGQSRLQQAYEHLRKSNEALLQEITERERAEAALRLSNQQLATARDAADTANRAKSAFLANMSHEIRTPLNAILGFAQVMQRSLALDTNDRENLAIIQRSGRSLLGLINNVLEMSKIEAGRLQISVRSFDLHALLEDLRLMFRLPATSKGLRLEITLADGLPQYVIGDDGRVRQILVNLLGNAIKFTDRGVVALRARALPEVKNWRLEIEVEDTGPGLAASEMARLFQSFEQTAIGIEKGGTGLGLVISRQYARAMGGDIVVSSQIGTGSVFRLTLPAGVGDPSAVAVVPRRVTGLRAGQETRRILIVDDQADNRLFLRRLLEPLGFDIHEAVDGAAALTAWTDSRPHLILMDLLMPVMNGHEAIRRIREQPDGHNCRIVVLSATVFDEDHDAILASGVDGYLRKPITDDELLAVIGQQLGMIYEYATAESTVPQSLVPCLPDEAAVARIPPVTQDAMRHAIARVNDLEMRNLIEQLPPDQAMTAEALRHLLDSFDWDTLETLLKQFNVCFNPHPTSSAE